MLFRAIFAGACCFVLGAARLDAATASDGPQSRQLAALSFSRDVIPLLTKAGCNMGACHGSLQGRGGFQLSLLGYQPEVDYDTLVKTGRGRRVSPAAPEQSLLLLKATASVPHGGGKRLDRDSAAYRVLREYIAQGLNPPAASEPAVVRLEVSPGESVTTVGKPLQLSARAHWSDGSVQDVTATALYESRFKEVAEVSATGEVTPLEPGRTAVTVRYNGQVAAVPVSVPYAQIAKYPELLRHNYIDDLAIADWQKLGVVPAPLSDDAEFLRRVYLDLIGTLPTADEVRAFLADRSADKRARAIDALLERPEYVDYWSLKWGDLLRVHRRYVGDKGLASFWGWVRRAVRENRPLDQLARDVLTAQGNLFTNGPVAYYFVDPKPEELAETTSQVFLGVRLQCTRCHRHPNEVWNQDDYYGLAAFFTRIEVKENGDQGRFGGARVVRPVAKASKNRRLAREAEPHLFDMNVQALESLDDIRSALADTVTSPDNPYFARNFANRYWAYLTGRGLVEPIDDFRATNPPTNPALLDALARDLVEHGFDAKHLIRTICNSRVYQLASEISPERDVEGTFFTHRQPRRMPAEVLLDAVNQAAGTSEEFAAVPAGTRAISLPDPSIPSYFLTTFGRPLRNSPCECARGSMPDLSQALHLVNGTGLHNKVTASKGRVARLTNGETSTETLVEELYLATLSRLPTKEETIAVRELVAEAPSLREGLEDLLWTLLNSSEFVFNH